MRRRDCLVPTWRGWLLLLILLAVLVLVAARGAYPFLAVTIRVPTRVLVVEGWAPDYALQAAIDEFQQGHYETMLVTGGPLEHGAPLSEYANFAELGRATLLKLGMPTNALQAVPAPLVMRDRTYTSGLSLEQWFKEQHSVPAGINLMTEGAHARRSWLMFEKALGRNVRVGIIAVPPREFDTHHWWRSSQGFRVVTGEALGYFYARFFFTSK
jgi:DUF218 domain